MKLEQVNEQALSTVDQPDALKKVNMDSLSVVDQMNAVVKITNNMQYQNADELLFAGNEMRKTIKAEYKPVKKAAKDAHTAVCDMEHKYFDPVDEACRKIKRAMSEYQAEQDRIRREAEEKERARLRKEQEEKRLQEAIRMESEGSMPEAVDAVLEEPIMDTPVIMPKTVPKTKTKFREAWKFRIDDPDKIPREFLMPDTVRIGQVVRAMKDACKIPGVHVYKEKV